jgi:hypothetical protein
MLYDMQAAATVGGDRKSIRLTRSYLGRASGSIWTVAGFIFAVYGWWIFVFFRTGHDVHQFALVERRYAQQSHISAAIKFGPDYHFAAPGRSYDGQFFYFLALDPVNARYYLDNPSYRYTKILYPLTARFLALDRSDLIPYTLILVNWLAMGLGTLAVAAWLRRRRVSPWFALIYGLYPGLFSAFQRDLTEPMAYALIALAVYLFDFGGRRRVLWSGLVFSLAVLTRDKSAVFATVYGLALLFDRTTADQAISWSKRIASNVPRAALLLGLAGIPMLLYKIFLHFWLGSIGVPPEQAVPLAGILSSLSLGDRVVETLSVFLPALICGCLGVWALWRRLWHAPIFLLLVSIDLGLVTLHPGYFVDPFGMLRVGTAVVLAALYCIPLFDRLTGKNRTWLLGSAACWLWLTVSWLILGLALLAG